MQIAVDAASWENQRGYGRHARALLSNLACLDHENRYTFVVDSGADLADLPVGAALKKVRAVVPAAIAASSEGHRSLPDMWRMSRALSASNFDLLLFPTVYSYVPVFSSAKKLVFIHDVIAERFPELTLPKRSARYFWQAKVALARRQADAIVTVSDFSRREIIDYFKLDPSRVFVAGEASDPVFRAIEYPALTPCLAGLGLREDDRLVTYVGGFGPHKNLEPLVEVFARFNSQPDFSQLRLVMVGEYQKEVFHSHYADLRRQIDDLGIAGRVIFTGYLPDEELVILLNRAEVLVLPSLMEGFGLPAVEAAACGCPVIATKASPLPGLLGDGGVYINPLKPEELERALHQVLESETLRQKMRSAGLAAAGRLTWEQAARELLAVIQHVAAQ